MDVFLGLSPTVWTALGTVVGVLAAAATAWAVVEARKTSRRILIWDSANVPLLSSTPAGFKVELLANGTVLQEPQIVEMTLFNDSKTDISSREFDANQPLGFEIGAKVIDLIASGQGLAFPLKAARADSSTGKLWIDPFLVKKQGRYRATLLVDGVPSVSLSEHAMLNVDVKQATSELEERNGWQQNRWLYLWIVFGVGLAVIAAWTMVRLKDSASVGPEKGVALSIPEGGKISPVCQAVLYRIPQPEGTPVLAFSTDGSTWTGVESHYVETPYSDTMTIVGWIHLGQPASAKPLIGVWVAPTGSDLDFSSQKTVKIGGDLSKWKLLKAVAVVPDATIYSSCL